MSRWLAVIAVQIVIATPAFAQPGGSWPFKDTGKVSFCTELGDPPSAYLDADGRTPLGMEVDFMQAIAKDLKAQADIKNFKFASIFAALDSGQCDAVMSQTSKSPERLQKYIFIDYRAQSSGLLVKKGNPQNLRTFEDLSGKRAAVLLGSANERRLKAANEGLAKAGKPEMTINSYPTNAIAFQELNLGRVDAFVSGSITLAYFMNTGAGGGSFEIGGLPVAPNTLGIMVPNTMPEKAKAIQAAWDNVVKVGQAKAIIEKWKQADGTTLCGPGFKCD